MTIFDNWQQFSQFRQMFLPFWQLKRQSWRFVTFETLITILTILTILTIFVTWQLIVTLDIIRNSCNVLKFSGTASALCAEAHWSSMRRVLVDLLFPKNIQCWCGFYVSYAHTETKIAFSTFKALVKGALRLVFFHCNF